MRASTGSAPAPDATSLIANNDDVAGAWGQFFENSGADGLGDLNQRSASLARQIRDNGVTYNVYADENGPQRPWSLDLFPLMIEPESWQQIELGVLQRMRLLEQVLGVRKALVTTSCTHALEMAALLLGGGVDWTRTEPTAEEYFAKRPHTVRGMRDASDLSYRIDEA